MVGALHAQNKVKAVDRIKESIEIKEFKSKYKNGVSIGVLEMSDGSTLTKGDKLVLGNPSSGSTFQLMFLNKYSVMSAMTAVFLTQGDSNTEVIIEEIRGWRNMGKITFSIDFMKADGSNYGLSKFANTFNLERALALGEIINPNQALTREQAIAKLKEAQDLMGLGMMSKEDFEALKAELTPIIMNQ